MNWTWAIAIEGLMRRGISSVHPLGLVVADPPASATFPEGDVFGGTSPCVRDVRLSSMSVAPVSGQLASQTLTCVIDLQDDDVARYFFAEASPIGALTIGGSGVSSGVNQVPITLYSGGIVSSEISADDVVYIGKEAFRVASVTGTAFNIASTLPSSVIYPDAGSSNDVSRATQPVGSIAQGFTIKRTHAARATANDAPPWNDDRVYLDNPSVRLRRVFLYRVGVNAAGECIQQLAGQYQIDADSLSTGADGLSMTFTAVALTGALSGAKINRRPVAYQGRVSASDDRLLFLCDNTPSLTDSLYFDASRGSARVVLANGSDVATVCKNSSASVLPESDVNGLLDTSSLFGGNLPSAQAPGEAPRSWYEVLVSDPMNVARSDAASTYPMTAADHPYYSTEAPDPDDPDATISAVLTHPLHMVLAHFGTIASNLPISWVVSVGPYAIDTDGILALARQVYVTNWPGVVAGDDGKPIDALKWLYESFLRPLGCGWGVDQFGRLTVRSLISPEIAATSQVGQSLALYGRAVQRSVKSAADAVVASIGGGIGAAQVIITGREAYLPDPDDPSSSVYEIQAQGATTPNNPTPGLEILQVSAVQIVRGYVLSLGAFLAKGARSGVITVTNSQIAEMRPDGMYDILPGQLITLTLLGLRGSTGAIADSEPVDAIVIQHTWEADYTAQKLNVLFLPYRISRIGAAAVITTVVDDGGGQYTITLDADDTIEPVAAGTPYVSPLGPFASDSETIENQSDTLGGAVVELSDQYLARKGEATYASRSGNDIVITGATAVPAVGDWVTLAPLGDNPGTVAESTIAFFGRDVFTI